MTGLVNAVVQGPNWKDTAIFLNGKRLNPKTDRRRDSRPNVRENAPILGDLMNDFNF